MASFPGGRTCHNEPRFSSKVSQNRWNRGQKSRFHGVCTLYLQFGGNLVADMVSFARPQA